MRAQVRHAAQLPIPAVVLAAPGKHVVVSPVPPGAESSAPGSRVKRGEVIATRDQFSRVFVAVQERLDEVTGLCRRTVVHPEVAPGGDRNRSGDDGERMRIPIERGRDELRERHDLPQIRTR